MKRAVDQNEVLNDTNFPLVAQRAIAKYEQKNMVIDALLWSAIIAKYDAALARAGVK
jgi:hypothetical protein